MNIQFYFKLFSDGGFKVFAGMGLDENYFEEHNRAVWAIEQHIKYLAEVHAGHSVTLYSRILGRSAKRLHFIQFMVNDTTEQLAATLEVLAFHIDLSIRRSAPFPEDLAERIDQRIMHDSQLDWDAPLSQPLQA